MQCRFASAPMPASDFELSSSRACPNQQHLQQRLQALGALFR